MSQAISRTDGPPAPLDGGPPRTVRSAGIPLTPLTPAAAARTLVRLVVRGTAADVHLCGTATLADADRDPGLQRLLRSAALNLPAGGGTARTVRPGGRPAARVYGPDLLLDTVRAGQREGLGHYLLGQPPGAENAPADGTATDTGTGTGTATGSATGTGGPAGAGLTAEILVRYPDAWVAGAAPLPGRTATADEWTALAARIRESGARLVWIGGSDTARQHRAAARLAAGHPAVYVAAGPAFTLAHSGARPAPLRARWQRWQAAALSHARFLRAAARERHRGRGPYRELVQLLADAEIDLVLDTAADDGAYVTGLRRAGYRGRVVSFEVLPGPREQLARRAAGDPGWSVLPYALGDGNGPDGGHRLDALWDAVTAPGERLFVRLRAPGHEERLLEGAGAYAPDCVGLQTRGERCAPPPGYTAVPPPVPGDGVLFRQA